MNDRDSRPKVWYLMPAHRCPPTEAILLLLLSLYIPEALNLCELWIRDVLSTNSRFGQHVIQGGTMCPFNRTGRTATVEYLTHIKYRGE